MRENIVDRAIIDLYQLCGVHLTSYSEPRSTMNTGTLGNYLRYDFHNMLSSDSADRLRWE